jgi:hypothetical protein
MFYKYTEVETKYLEFRSLFFFRIINNCNNAYIEAYNFFIQNTRVIFKSQYRKGQQPEPQCVTAPCGSATLIKNTVPVGFTFC